MTLEDLAMLPDGGSSFVDPDLATTNVIKHSYMVMMASDAPAPATVPAACNEGAIGTGFHATAIPVSGGGAREFGTNATGTIFFTVLPAEVAISDLAVTSGEPLR
jgi:hypothetical protein